MFYIQLTSKAGKLELQEEKILREIGVFVLQLQDEIYLYFKNYIVPISVLRYSGFRNIPWESSIHICCKNIILRLEGGR